MRSRQRSGHLRIKHKADPMCEGRENTGGARRRFADSGV